MIPDIDRRKNRIEELLVEQGFEITQTIHEALRDTKLVNLYATRDRKERSTKRMAAPIITNPVFWKERVRNRLAEILPDYMIPAVITSLAELPVSSNGKLNRQRLLELQETGADRKRIIDPRNLTEWLLAREFRAALGLDKVSVDESFFHLGGTSLSGLKLVEQFEGRFAASSLSLQFPSANDL